MNPAAVRLFLTLLWLLPGLGFLLNDMLTGRTIGFEFGRWRVPLWLPCLLMAGFDFIRWWAVRSRPAASESWRRRPRRRSDPDAEPNSAFRFDDPPNPAGGEQNR
jgi:hypothetical protein